MVFILVFGAASVNAETAGNYVVSGSNVVDPVPGSTLPAEPSSSLPQASAQTDSPRQKSMPATVLLWLVVPGGGNFYAGDKTKGFIQLCATLGGVALMARSIHDECSAGSRFVYCSEEISPGRFYSGLGAVAGVRIWGLITAIHRTQDINPTSTVFRV